MAQFDAMILEKVLFVGTLGLMKRVPKDMI